MNTQSVLAVSALSLLSLGFASPSLAQVAITDFKPKVTEVAIKKSTTLSWKSTGVVGTGSPCTASGAWSGTKPASATSSSTGNLNAAGVQEFVLTCPGANGTSATARTTVTVVDVPTLTFTASESAINPGEPVTLTWDSANTSSCTASGGWTGAQALDGSLTLSNLTKGLKTFSLACKGVAGTVTKKVTVNVVPVAAITSFTATPTSVLQGKTVSLKWATTDATACTASGDTAGGTWGGARAKSGSATVGPLSEDSTFEITCTGPGGSDSAEVTVAVLPPPTVDLSLSEEVIEPGQSVTLLWETENAASCKASGGWSGDKDTQGSETRTEPTKGKKTYTLTCTGSGVSVKDTVTLTVVAAPTLTFSTNLDQVGFEKATTLKWSSTDATTCIASGDWSGDRKTSGSVSTGPLTASTNTFILTCIGPAGEASEAVTVDVLGKPDVTLSLSDTELEVGQSVVIDWSSTDATSCKASGGVTGWATTDRGLDGSLTFDKLAKGDKTFTLSCTGPGGVTEVKQVLGVDAAPEITEFKASQATGVTPNTAVTLGWKTSDALECIASGAWATPGKVAVNGSANSAPLTKRTNSFTLTCKSKRFEVSDTITVETTVATEVTLSASAETAFVGQSVTLSWTSKDAVKCVGTGGGFAGDKALQGTGSTGPLAKPGTNTFTLRCESASGAVDEKSVSIEVEAPALSADVGSIEFAAQDLGTTSAVKSVRLTNKGTLSVPLQISLNGVDVSQFSIDPKCPSVLVAGASCAIDIKFAPTTIGVKNVELGASSAAAGVQIKIPLSGVGRSAASQTAFFSAQARPAVGTLATVAGVGPAQIAGDGGPALAASLRSVGALARGDDGTLYISDAITVRAVDPKTGVITRVAGTGSPYFDSDGKLAIDTSFSVGQIRQGADGAGYVLGGLRIRRIDPSTRRVATVVGTGVYGCTDALGLLAKDAKITGGDFVFDARGNIFLTQYPDETEKCMGAIRRVDAASGVITTLAVKDLPASFAPTILTIDPKGNLYAYDEKNFQIFRIDAKPLADGRLQATAIAGVAGKQGDTTGAGDGGPATAAPLNSVVDIVVNGGGQVFIADNISARIRRIDTAGIISTVAGAGFPLSASAVLLSMPARNGAQTNPIGTPRALSFDADGNLLFGEELNDFTIPASSGFFTYGLVRKLNLQTGEITVVVGRIALPGFAGDGSAAVNASFAIPSGLEFDPAGNLFIGDRLNRRLRRIDANTGVITSVPGAGDGVNVGTAPTYVTTDAAGNVYYADRGFRIHKVDASSGAVTVIAGNGQAGFTADGAAAGSSRIGSPLGVATDGSGNVYFVENSNGRIRKVSNTGVLTTVAGIGYPATGAPVPPTGDGGLASAAFLQNAVDVAHFNGKLYFTDARSEDTGLAGLVREINLADGKIRRIAGNGQAGAPARSGLATESPLGQLFGLAIDAAGNVFFADVSTQSLVRVDAVSGQISRVVGGQLGFAGDGGPASGAALNVPQGLALDRRGNLFFADRSNNRIRAAFCVGAPAQGEVSQCDANANVSGIKRVLISWNQPGAFNCIASGSAAFSGPRASSGAEWVALPGTGGINNFTLQCTTPSGTTVSRLEVYSNDGRVTPSRVEAALKFSTSAMNFPGTVVGVASAPQTLQVTNPGSAAVSLGNVLAAGSGEFVSSSDCINRSLAPGASCQITVVFKPNAPGAKGGAVAVFVNGASVPMFVPLSGFGIDAQATQTRFFNVTASPVPGVVATAAGTGPERVAGDGGVATEAAISSFGFIAVSGIVAADDGYFFTDGVEIRKVERSQSPAVFPRVLKLAGNGQPYFDGDNKPGLQTGINARKLIAGPLDEDAGYFIQGNRIRRISAVAPNIVTTIVNDGGITGSSGDGGPAVNAALDAPADIAFDSSGKLFIADYNAGRIRIVDPVSKNISTAALTGVPNGFRPLQIVIDGSSSVYVFDDGSKRVYRFGPTDGNLKLVAGTGSVGQSGDGGLATEATLGAINAMLVTPSGQLLLADTQFMKIRAVDLASGKISTVAGQVGSPTAQQGVVLEANKLVPVMPAADGQPIGAPGSLALDPVDRKTVIVGETVQDFSAGAPANGFTYAGIIRRLDLEKRTLTIIAGRGHLATFGGDGAAAVTAKLRVPTGIEFDADNNLYIGDRVNGRLRRVDASSGVIESVFADETRPSWASNAAIAGTRAPAYVATDAAGNVYYVEWRGNRVMRWNKASKAVEVFAGTGTSGFAGDGGPATAAQLAAPLGLAVDSAGNVYVAASGRIRRITPTGTISTIAGIGPVSSNATATPPLGDGGPATAAYLLPHELAARGTKLYFTDEASNTIRVIDLATGIVTRIAGNGVAGLVSDSGAATATPLGQIWGLAVDRGGSVFFAEANTNRVMRVDGTTGAISRAIGGQRGFGGDGGMAFAAAINTPQGVAIDRRGNLYFADRSNNRIRVALCFAPPEDGQASDCEVRPSAAGVRRVLVSWYQPGAYNCVAGGAWAGPRASTGAEWIAPLVNGVNRYTLTCNTSESAKFTLESVVDTTVVTAKAIDPTADSKSAKTPSTAPTVTVPSQSLFIGRSGVSGGDSAGAGDASDGEAGVASATTKAMMALGSATDANTGSRYVVLGGPADASGLQPWRLEYRDSGDALISARELRSMAEVIWRSNKGAGTALPTTTQVAVCANQVWTAQDGYQIAVAGSDLSLQGGWQAEAAVSGGAEANLIAGLSCSGAGVSVSGYSFGVSAQGPALSRGQVDASAFDIVFDARGTEVSRSVKPVKVSVPEICSAGRGDVSTQRFCEAWGKAASGP